MKHGLSFVMGTTGGDRDNINEQNMQASSCKAVVAPNMAKQIVALQVLKRAEERGILHSYLFYLLLSLTLLKTGLL
jgi:dihydrodipicolinate reductase